MRLRRFGRPRGGAGALTCRELVRLITDYLEGSLPDRERRRFERHLKDCEGCTTSVEQMRETIAATGRLRESSLDPRTREELLRAFRDWERAER